MTASTRLTPRPSIEVRKSHRIFLDALRGSLDSPQLRPMCHVIIVHGRAPAKDVMADKESGHDADRDGDEGNFGKRCKLEVELRQADGRGFRKRRLNEIVKRSVPVVDRDADLNLEIGSEQDQRRAKNRPARPRVGRQEHPGRCEQRDSRDKIEIEPQKWRRPKYSSADNLGAGSLDVKPQQFPQLRADCVPEADREGSPQER